MRVLKIIKIPTCLMLIQCRAVCTILGTSVETISAHKLNSMIRKTHFSDKPMTDFEFCFSNLFLGELREHQRKFKISLPSVNALTLTEKDYRWEKTAASVVFTKYTQARICRHV